MDLVPTAEEAEMVATVDQFLADKLSIPHLRERLATGDPVGPAGWGAAAEMGLFSLHLPEDAGGAGLSIVEAALVFVPTGRHLAPVGFIAAVVGAQLAHEAGLGEVRDAIAAGRPVGLALAAPGTAVGDEITGELTVLDGAGADHVVVVAADGRTVALIAGDHVPGGKPVECLDPSTAMSRTVVDGAPALAASSAAAGGTVHRLGIALTAAMLVGIASAALDQAVAYACEREQFGRPIGIHQAIKHPCADAAVRCEAATSQLAFAVVGVRDDRPDAEFQLAVAKRLAEQAARRNCRTNVQVHGGMGYTWEHDAHLYLSRAVLLDHCFGSNRHQQATILDSAPSVP